MLGSDLVVIEVTKDSNSSPSLPSVIKMISEFFNCSPVAASAPFKIYTLVIYSSMEIEDVAVEFAYPMNAFFEDIPKHQLTYNMMLPEVKLMGKFP